MVVTRVAVVAMVVVATAGGECWKWTAGGNDEVGGGGDRSETGKNHGTMRRIQLYPSIP